MQKDSIIKIIKRTKKTHKNTQNKKMYICTFFYGIKIVQWLSKVFCEIILFDKRGFSIYVFTYF